MLHTYKDNHSVPKSTFPAYSITHPAACCSEMHACVFHSPSSLCSAALYSVAC